MIFLSAIASFLYLDIKNFLSNVLIAAITYVVVSYSFFPFVGQIEYITPDYMYLIYLLTTLVLTKIKHDQLLSHLEDAETRELAIKNLENIKSFVSVVAHRFGTPLNIMRLKVDRISRGKFKDEEIADLVTTQEKLELILNSLRNSVYRVDTILDKGNIRLGNLLSRLDDNELKIVLSDIDNEILIAGNEDLLVFCIEDIIKNAKEAGASTIELSFVEQGSFIWLKIKDNGTGFDHDLLIHEISSFVSTKGDKNLGISLFSIKNYLNTIGGELKIENLQNGACVSMMIPKYENRDS